MCKAENIQKKYTFDKDSSFLGWQMDKGSYVCIDKSGEYWVGIMITPPKGIYSFPVDEEKQVKAIKQKLELVKD